jgi:inosose dehydratase
MEGEASISRNGVVRGRRPVGVGAAGGRRLAGAPISWGVCEVPGWGRMLPPDRVLSEMASLGLAATELGPLGYLSLDADRVRELLDRHGLGLAAAFVPLVLHEESLEGTRATVDQVAPLLASFGGEVLVAAAVMDAAWSPPKPLDERQWRRLVEHLAVVDELVAGHGLTLALHPHAGTLIEAEADVERVLAESAVPCCLDTGHLAIGGADPVGFVRRHAERIAHVHLKDVDLRLAARVRAGELSLVDATRRGLFLPLGSGDAEIGEVVALLDRHGYERWLVLEQDTTITGEEPPVGNGPVLDVRRSVEYLATLAPANRGGVPQS